MINFNLTPPSGYADSYFDVQFTCSFPVSDNVEITIFNNTINQQLDILSVSGGYISNENVIHADSLSAIDGYINIFNKDKMNSKLKDFTSIDIKAIIKINGESHEKIVQFYNQSQSIDANILPFDLSLSSNVVDIKNNIPLILNVIGDENKKYELSVMSKDRKQKCVFEIMIKKGKNIIEVPSEILWSDLDITKNYTKKFDIYWSKYEGINYQRFMNRRYVLIQNTTLTFNQPQMLPQKQARLGPTGLDLPKQFVLSNRYFVHTWKDFSDFGGLPDGYGAKRMDYLTRFFHESQNMQQTVISPFSVSPKNEIKQTVRQHDMSNKHKTVHPFMVNKSQSQFLQSFGHTVQKQKTDTQDVKKSGCGCSRKQK